MRQFMLYTTRVNANGSLTIYATQLQGMDVDSVLGILKLDGVIGENQAYILVDQPTGVIVRRKNMHMGKELARQMIDQSKQDLAAMDNFEDGSNVVPKED